MAGINEKKSSFITMDFRPNSELDGAFNKFYLDVVRATSEP